MITKLWADPERVVHAVHFYADEDELVSVACGYLAAGVKRRGAAIAIATPEHGARFEAALVSSGLDLGVHRGARLHVVDAGQTLARLMVGGRPDVPFRTRDPVDRLLRHGCVSNAAKAKEAATPRPMV
jgi:hypothetical protein